MRYKNLIGFVWVAVIMGLFTSCLKDINNVYNPGTTIRERPPLWFVNMEIAR